MKDIEVTGDQARWWCAILCAGAFAALGTTIFAPQITTSGRLLGVALTVAALALAAYWFRHIE